MAQKDNISGNIMREPEPEVAKKPTGKKKDPPPIQNVLNGTFLTSSRTLRVLPFLLFLALLGIVYIGNIYYAEKRIRTMNELRKEIKELRYEFITGKTQLEDRRKQSEIAKKLEPEGIRELTIPPGKLIVPQQNPLKE